MDDSDHRASDERLEDKHGSAGECTEGASNGPILILGAVNTGKTTVFEKLTRGRSTEVAVPGASCSLQKGVVHVCGPHQGVLKRLVESVGSHRNHDRCPAIFDTPGTATLFPQNDEEAGARDGVLRLRPASLLIVADAKNVRRSLALTLHAAELGLPMLMAVNMSDEATRRGIGVDTERLSRMFGIDVVATTGPEGEGLEELERGLGAPRVPRQVVSYPEPLAAAMQSIEEILEPAASALPCSTRGLALLLLGRDGVAQAIVEEQLGDGALEAIAEVVADARREVRRPLSVALTDVLYDAADRIASEAVHTSPGAETLLDRFGRLAEHPLWGIFVATAVIVAMYYWVGVLGATIVVDAINVHVFHELLTPLGDWLVAPIPWAFVRDAIMDRDFGMLPTGLFLAFGIVMPVLFFFFFAFGVLQSSGYLPRLSVLLDRVFRVIGLNGKGVMPLVMGLSCVTMALITTRMLETRKERVIASFLLLVAFPCAPLVAVMFVVLGEMPVSASITLFGILAAEAVLGSPHWAGPQPACHVVGHHQRTPLTVLVGTPHLAFLKHGVRTDVQPIERGVRLPVSIQGRKGLRRIRLRPAWIARSSDIAVGRRWPANSEKRG